MRTPRRLFRFNAGPQCFRRVAIRYDKLDSVFLAFIHLALIDDALQLT